MLNLFTLFLYIGGYKMNDFINLFVNNNDLYAFFSPDVFGVVFIILVLVSTILCIILGRGGEK